MAVKHLRKQRLPGEQDQSADTSLRAKALERALSEQPPRTLTPYEWQQWYAEHGVPSSHRSPSPPLPWWRRLLASLTRGRNADGQA